MFAFLRRLPEVSGGTIVFSDIEVGSDTIEFLARYCYPGEHEVRSYPIFLRQNVPNRPPNDLIAVALSTLCGKRFQKVHIDISFSEATRAALAYYMGCELTSRGSGRSWAPRKENSDTLNFSGGFDSLAALCLMPDQTKLVSMDFGGRFSRERAFFESFNPVIVSTNLAETPFRTHNWSFMGIASILAQQYFGTERQSFGSILEASASQFSTKRTRARDGSVAPFNIAGITTWPYTSGLTEIGTILILSHFKPDAMSSSLTSLASPGEEKLYRKYLLTQIVSERYHRRIDVPQVPEPTRAHYKWGQNFAVDYLSLYTIKYRGIEVASKTVSEIPDQAVAFVNSTSLSSMEKLHPDLYQDHPDQIQKRIFSRCNDAGVHPFCRDDYEDIEAIKRFLAPSHPLIAG